MSKTIRVLIYLPFYSGKCESRHARMHDLIQSMDETSKELSFEFTVIAERGRDSLSANILYAKFPFLKRYTESYHIPRTPTVTPNTQESKELVQNKDQSHDLISKTQSDLEQEPVFFEENKSDPSFLSNSESVSIEIAESDDIELSDDTSSDDNVVLLTLKRSYRLLKQTRRLLIRTIRISKRILIRTLRITLRLIKRLARRTKKNIIGLVRKATKYVGMIRQFKAGTAHPYVWRWCKSHAVSNIDKVGRVDIFHIVRPNSTSNKMEAKLLARNPKLKVIVGPNLMAYGHPSNGFNFDDFAKKKISRVLAISSYHEQLLNEFGFSETMISRLPPSVNPKYFSPPLEQKKDETFTIIFVASQFSVEKGALDFLNAIDKLEQEEKLEFKAIMIGGFEVNETVQTAVEDTVWSNASKRITFAGKIARESMQQYYRDADVFVHTGEAENGPTTIIEALSCGTDCLLPNHMCFKEPELTNGTHYYEKGNLDQIVSHIYNISSAKKNQQPTFLPTVTHKDTIDYISKLYHAVNNENN